MSWIYCKGNYTLEYNDNFSHNIINFDRTGILETDYPYLFVFGTFKTLYWDIVYLIVLKSGENTIIMCFEWMAFFIPRKINLLFRRIICKSKWRKDIYIYIYVYSFNQITFTDN